MGRSLLILCAALTLGACGDPLVVIGDLPGFMRITVGRPDTTGFTSDSIATRTRLTRPSGLVVSKTGVLYFGDQSSRLFSVTPAGKLTELHKSLACFEKTCLGRPQGIALNLDENALYIVDDMTDKIWRLTLANKELTTFAGTGLNGVAADGTPAAQATLASPSSIVQLPDGRLAFAERNSGRIRSIGSDGILRTIASNFSNPTGLAYSNGTLYVSETGPNAHRVSSVDLATGSVTIIAGTGAQGYFGDGGLAVDARLNTPWSLAVSGSQLFIADQLNNRVRAVNLQSGTITTFAGTGLLQFTGNGRSAAETSIIQPNGLALSSFGFLYISDGGHNVVWRTPVGINQL